MDATTGPTLAPGASGRETPPREIKKRSTTTSATAGLARARPPTRHTASASAALSSQRRPYRPLCAEAGGERRRTAGRARLSTTACTVFASRGHCEENRSALIRLSAFVLPISLHALAAKRWTSDTRPYSILGGSPAKSLGEVSCWASSGPVRYRIKPVLNRSANDVSDNEPIPTVREQIPRRIVNRLLDYRNRGNHRGIHKRGRLKPPLRNVSQIPSKIQPRNFTCPRLMFKRASPQASVIVLSISGKSGARGET